MRNIWIIFKREMLAYFCSSIAYIVSVCVLVIMGFSFFTIVNILSESPSDFSPSMWFFNGMFTWIVLLIVPPVITMRLFAEDKKTGLIESLMTTPLRDVEYVLGKFLGACFFFILLWSPTFNYVFILRHYANDTTPLDLGPIFGGYLSLFLIGILMISVGCMASASTRNQIIGAIFAFAVNGVFFFSGIYFYANVADKHRSFFESFSMLAHMQEMSRGVVEWERIVFYISSTLLFLIITHRIVQSRHWKN